jgi:hypothetical protein
MAAIRLDRLRLKRRGERLAISEKLLRPAGYSLQLQIERLTEEAIWWMLGSVAASLALACTLGSPSPDTIGRSAWLVFLAVSAAVCCVVSWRKVKRGQYSRLGWFGEQAMAEYLSGLAANDCRLFHDVPCDRGNIDHVVVGPFGIFAVETKCWSKRLGKFSAAKHEAVFDGNAIRLPWGITDAPLKQARRNQRWLEGFLAKSTGEPVAVQAIVALPGWWVSLSVKIDSGVWVLSGKQVAGRIAGEQPKLPPKTIQQVAYQLEQRCRDVEF